MSISKLFPFVSILLYVVLCQSCVEQVDAEFDLQSDIIFIDAYALTEPGISTVTVKKSIFENQTTYKVVDLSNSLVEIENINTGEIIEFLEDIDGVYRCPADFAASVGDEWKLYIELEDGKKIESKAQIVSSAVPIDNVQAEYSPEIEFSAEFGRIIPGHRLSIDWQDPPGEENYYLWKYKTFEPLFVCKTCKKGVLRNGECQPTGVSWGPPYYSYTCLPDCWEIKLGDELPIFNDRLEDGAAIIGREIAILPYYRRPSILVEIQQYSLDKSAYEYFKVINSQISDNGGLNAPPPAALLGNLFNPNDDEDLILGNFTAAGISTKRLFVDRSDVVANTLREEDPIYLENCVPCPTTAPCEESATRTGVKPVGWP